MFLVALFEFSFIFIFVDLFTLYLIVKFIIPSKRKSFEEKHVIITGASQGLGEAVALNLAKKGANISIISRTQEKLEQVKEQMESVKKNPNQNFFAISGDTTQTESITEAIKQAIKKNGAPDYVICNAGSSRPGLFNDIPVEDFESQANLNYLGYVRTVKAALPSMIERNKGGNITFVASVLGITTFVGYSAYSPTKFAVKGLADCLKNELLMYGIDVSLYLAAEMDTPGLQKENETKPKITREIEGTGATFSPEEAAQILINGLELGKYAIVTDTFWELLSVPMKGFIPKTAILIDALIAPFLVLVGGIYLWDVNRKVKSMHKVT